MARRLLMEDRGSPAFEEEQWYLCGDLSSPAPTEGPAVQTSKSLSSAHRHLNRRNGLSKLCQSRMALSGDDLLWSLWASAVTTTRESLVCRVGCWVRASGRGCRPSCCVRSA